MTKHEQQNQRLLEELRTIIEEKTGYRIRSMKKLRDFVDQAIRTSELRISTSPATARLKTSNPKIVLGSISITPDNFSDSTDNPQPPQNKTAGSGAAKKINALVELIQDEGLTADSLVKAILEHVEPDKVTTLRNASTNYVGSLGGKELRDALEIHPSREKAFEQQLNRNRKQLGDDNWSEVTNPCPNTPRYLYLVQSKPIQKLAKRYKSPQSA